MEKLSRNTQIICIANNKGGVGKTSTAINLAAALALAGKRTCVIDLDAQCSAGKGLGVRFDESDDRYTTMDALVQGVPLTQIMIPLENRFNDNLWLAPGHPGLRQAPEVIRGEFYELLRGEGTDLMPAQFERQYIDRLSRSFDCDHGLDFILIDTPPDIGFHLTAALFAARWLLVTMFTDGDSIDGLNDITLYASEMIDELQIDLQLLGVLLGNVRSGLRFTRDITQRLLEIFGTEGALIETQVPQRTKVPEARDRGLTVFEYAPNESVCESFERLAQQVIHRITVMGQSNSSEASVVNG